MGTLRARCTELGESQSVCDECQKPINVGDVVLLDPCIPAVWCSEECEAAFRETKLPAILEEKRNGWRSSN